METSFANYLLKFALWSGILFCILILIVHFYSLGELSSFFIAYILSFAFVGSNFWNVKNVKIRDHGLFQRRFYRNMAVRVVLVLAVIIVVLLVENEGQVFFIISFMFSYLCLSVIEVLTIKKLLEIDRRIDDSL